VLAGYVGIACGWFAAALACAAVAVSIFVFVFVDGDEPESLVGVLVCLVCAFGLALAGVQALEAPIRFSRLLRRSSDPCTATVRRCDWPARLGAFPDEEPQKASSCMTHMGRFVPARSSARRSGERSAAGAGERRLRRRLGDLGQMGQRVGQIVSPVDDGPRCPELS
jgi:hypothetical protein